MRNRLLVLLCLVANVAVAQDHEAVLEKYLTDDVVAVGYLDLSQIDTLGALEWAEKLGFGPEQEQRGQAMKLMLMIQQQLDRVADFGARYVYVLFRVADISHGGPTWVIPVDPGGDPQAVMGMILSGRPDQRHVERDTRPVFFPEHCKAVEGAVLGANSEAQLQILRSKRPTTKRDLSAAWRTLGQGHCGLLVCGDKDSRRVLREMFPALPQPFQAIDGELLADRLLWGGVVADLPPQPRLQVMLQTDQESSAKVLQQSVTNGLALLQQLPIDQQVLSTDDRETLVKALVPQITENRLEISCDDLLGNLDRMAHLLKPRVESAREAAQRAQRINKFKQILLAMHNYHSAKGTFPPRSTFSQDGKPLLSWRVHLLPYLEQGELYKQFHLDEPWDSEHNKQLIPLMPEVYADPDPAVSKRNAAGRTTYLVPTGPGTVFSGADGALIKDIIDGLSNTIMLVEVPAHTAPVWSRPKDCLIDTGVPWERLRRNDRDWFTAGYCDGHVDVIPFSIPEQTFRALVTMAGRDSVELP